MKTLVYETKFDSRAALRDRIFAAAEHIRNHPNNIASATPSLWCVPKTALQLVEDILNNYCKAGTYFSSYVVGLYRNAQSAMLRHHWAFSCILLGNLRTTMTWVRLLMCCWPCIFAMINFRFQLMHYNSISLIIFLYMFRAPMCPSSGGSTIHSQQLVQCHLIFRPYSR